MSKKLKKFSAQDKFLHQQISSNDCFLAEMANRALEEDANSRRLSDGADLSEDKITKILEGKDSNPNRRSFNAEIAGVLSRFLEAGIKDLNEDELNKSLQNFADQVGDSTNKTSFLDNLLSLAIFYDKRLVELNNQMGHTILHQTAIEGSKNAIEFLIRNGADVNSKITKESIDQDYCDDLDPGQTVA